MKIPRKNKKEYGLGLEEVNVLEKLRFSKEVRLFENCGKKLIYLQNLFPSEVCGVVGRKNCMGSHGGTIKGGRALIAEKKKPR